VDADPGDPDVAGRQTSAANSALADHRVWEVRRLLIAGLSRELRAREMGAVAHRIGIKPGVEVRDVMLEGDVDWLEKRAGVSVASYVEMLTSLPDGEMGLDQQTVAQLWRQMRSVAIRVEASKWAPQGRFK